MGSRRQSREAALKFLYQRDSGFPSVVSSAVDFARHFEVPEAHRSFYFDIVYGIESVQLELDEAIQAVAEHWKLSRMARVDRCILRMATWELRFHQEAPYRVILDEAVELAKKYSSAESPSFVNGLLDQLSKRYRADEVKKSGSETQKFVG